MRSNRFSDERFGAIEPSSPRLADSYNQFGTIKPKFVAVMDRLLRLFEMRFHIPQRHFSVPREDYGCFFLTSRMLSWEVKLPVKFKGWVRGAV